MTQKTVLPNAQKKRLLLLPVLLTVMGLAGVATAQDAAQNTPPAQAIERNPAGVNESTFVLNNDKDWKIKNSLFFLPNEVIAIMQARRGILQSEKSYEDNPVDMGPRYVSLAGISYIDANDWTIWLNDEKITPNNIPERVIDLVVHKDYINIKWHDVVKQRVVVFTLKPHQRFHLDTGLLLPG